jgi:molecular chaperone DnaJ
MAGKRDYYEILELSRDADPEAIKSAYARLARKYHPDLNPGDEQAEARFKEVTEAYEVLSDPDKRARYDRYGHAGLEENGPGGFRGPSVDPFDLFAQFFGFRDFGRRGPQPGQDRLVQVEIDLLEAAQGTRRTVEVDRLERCGECGGSGIAPGARPATCPRCRGMGVFIQQAGLFQMQTTCQTCGGRGAIIRDPCPRCSGYGMVKVRRKIEVQIPPGVDSGTRIRVRGEGDAGEPGAPRGDLYVETVVREHPLFRREGPHLICTVPISFSQAALGAEIEVPTLEGKEKIHLPRGTQYGHQVRLRGRGMPSLRGRERGDLVIEIVIETPRKLTKRQEELYRELAQIEQKHVTPQQKSFFDQLKDWLVGRQPAPEARKQDEGGPHPG